MSKQKTTYQSASDELDRIVKKLENEEVSIDELESLVKRGRELVTFCSDRLKSTHQQIDKLDSEIE